MNFVYKNKQKSASCSALLFSKISNNTLHSCLIEEFLQSASVYLKEHNCNHFNINHSKANATLRNKVL